MKILIAASIPANGGYEEEALANALYRQLHELGYEADYFLPYENDILSLPEQLLAYRLLKIGSCDELITIDILHVYWSITVKLYIYSKQSQRYVNTGTANTVC